MHPRRVPRLAPATTLALVVPLASGCCPFVGPTPPPPMMETCETGADGGVVTPLSFVDLTDGGHIPHVGGSQGSNASHVQFQVQMSAAPASRCTAFAASLVGMDGVVYERLEGSVRVGPEGQTSMIYLFSAGRALPEPTLPQPPARLEFTAGGETISVRLEDWGDAGALDADAGSVTPDAGT